MRQLLLIFIGGGTGSLWYVEYLARHERMATSRMGYCRRSIHGGQPKVRPLVRYENQVKSGLFLTSHQ